MANKYPLVFNTTTSRVEEIVSGDVLNLTGNGILDSTGAIGSANQVLTTNGSVVTWANASGGSNALYYRPGNSIGGSSVTTAQNILGVAVTLTGATIYDFEGFFGIYRTTATTATSSINLQFGGTATVYSITYTLIWYFDNSSFTNGTQKTDTWLLTTTGTTGTLGSVGTGDTTGGYLKCFMKGTVNINAGGTFSPQYKLSAAAGAFITTGGSYFKLTPLTSTSGTGTSTVASAGTWA